MKLEKDFNFILGAFLISCQDLVYLFLLNGLILVFEVILIFIKKKKCRFHYLVFLIFTFSIELNSYFTHFKLFIIFL